jgi:hypothetical protein
MNCLKCGAETQDRQVFCPKCQESMKAYPVRPDTPVSIPVRKATAPSKKPAPRQPKPEEIIQRLRRRVTALTITALVLLAALGISLFGMYQLWQNQDDGPALGQNYSTSPSASGHSESIPGRSVRSTTG